ATYRNKRDGLTQNERALLRLPDRYSVEEVGPGHWWANHRDVDAIFAAMRVDGRTVRILSNVGNEYVCRVEDDSSVTCPCPHAERMREQGTPGLCKHAAVTVAVADHCRAEKRRREEPKASAPAAQQAAPLYALMHVAESGERTVMVSAITLQHAREFYPYAVSGSAMAGGHRYAIEPSVARAAA